MVFDRQLDPYRDWEEKPWEHEGSEGWVLSLLVPVLLAHYPQQPPSEAMAWPLFMPHEPLEKDATVVRLLGCDGGDKDEATWKEVRAHARTHMHTHTHTHSLTHTLSLSPSLSPHTQVVLYRHRSVVHVFNLVSHGRPVLKNNLAPPLLGAFSANPTPPCFLLRPPSTNRITPPHAMR